jgi:transposase-like protein
MAKNKYNKKTKEMKELISKDRDLMKELMKLALEEFLEGEMTETLNAFKNEQTIDRSGYRSGYYTRQLVTRIGNIELRIPRDRSGKFSTDLFERYQRSEKALVSTLVEMYVQGVSTRRVKKVTEELCGHEFSASTISNMNKSLDEKLKKFANRKLEEEYPYLILDARYEKVRINGVVYSQAILIAIGVTTEGYRQILAVELANRESNSSWKEFLEKLKHRGLRKCDLIISDNHSGLRRAIREVFFQIPWQRCYVHFLRNALDHLPGKANDDCLQELRWLYDRRNIKESKEDLDSWLDRWGKKYPKLCIWVEENISETLTFYKFPKQHHKHLKSTNLLERLNEEIRRRTRVVRIFPNEESCLRLIRAVTVEIHEDWIERNRYLNMEFIKEQKKQELLAVKMIA